MPLPLGITTSINQKDLIPATGIHRRFSPGHNDNSSQKSDGLTSNDGFTSRGGFKKEISELLLSPFSIHMMQVQASVLSLPAALTHQALDYDVSLSAMLTGNNIGSPFILAGGQALNLNGSLPHLSAPSGNAGARRAVPLQAAASFHQETGKALKSLLMPEDLTDLIMEKIFGNGYTKKEEGFASISDITVPEKGESGTYDTLKISTLGAIETGQDPVIGASQPGDKGDVNNRPDSEKMPGLSFKNNASDRVNFREGPEENKERATEKTALYSIPIDSNPDLVPDTNSFPLQTPSDNAGAQRAVPLHESSPLLKDFYPTDNVSDIFSKGPIQLFRDNTGSIRINLDGDELGRLKLDISVRDNMVKADIVTEYPAVKEMIEINQGQLRDALSGHGLEISYLSVSVEGGQSECPNYKDVRGDTPVHKNNDREMTEEDYNLVCHTSFQQDSSINIFV